MAAPPPPGGPPPDDPQRPEVVYLAVTGRCHLACVHCDMWQHEGQADLPTATWLDILDRLADFCAPALVQLVGGEPLLRRDLEQLVARASDRGFRVGTCTNGWPVTPRRAHSLAEAGLDIAYLSLDGVGPATVDATRGRPGSYDHARRAIDLFAREPGVEVVLSSILHAGNAHEFAALVALAEAEGHGLMVQTLNQTLGRDPLETSWFARSPLWPHTPEDLGRIDAALDVLREARARGAAVLNTGAQLEAARAYYHDPLGPPRGPCPAGATECGVGPEGEMMLCFYRQPVARLAAGGEVAAVWRGEAATARRQEIAECRAACRLNTSNIGSFGVG